MSAPDLWMPLHITRYLMDTKDLDLAQHGAYLLLLMQYWQKGPLPDDDGKLCRIIGADIRTWRKAIGPAIRPFFSTRDGKLHQKRADLELAKAADISDKRRAAALASHQAPPRGGGGVSNQGAIAGANAHAKAGASARAFAPYTVPLNQEKKQKEVVQVSVSNHLLEGPVSAREPAPEAFSDAAIAAAITGLAKSQRMKAYPPREPLRTRNDQVAVIGKPPARPNAFHLTREQINHQLQMRRRRQ